MKKLFIIISIILISFVSCNKSTKPDFLVSDLVGKWINENDIQDYFIITEGGSLGAPDNSGKIIYAPIRNWNPYERFLVYELSAAGLSLRFTSSSYCEVSYSNMMQVYRK